MTKRKDEAAELTNIDDAAIANLEQQGEGDALVIHRDPDSPAPWDRDQTIREMIDEFMPHFDELAHRQCVNTVLNGLLASPHVGLLPTGELVAKAFEIADEVRRVELERYDAGDDVDDVDQVDEKI